MKTVSVLMSVYNEKYEWIEEAVNSILRQQDVQIQLIIVVDNPNENALVKFIQELSENRKNIEVVVNKINEGLVNSLNTALSYATGEYIARMDADDISYLNRFSAEIKYLKQYNLDFVMAETLLMAENGEKIKSSTYPEMHGKTFEKMELIKNISRHSTWLAKKKVFFELNGYRKIEFTEDLDFIYRAIEKGYKLGKMGEPLVKYRVRDNGITKTNLLAQWKVYSKLRKLANKKTVSRTSPKKINSVIKKLTDRQKMSFIKSNDLLYMIKQTNNIIQKTFLFFKLLISSKYVLELITFQINSRIKGKNL
ncbi:glycosyltransferase [Dellaglioa sp. BT-FLS60]